MIGESDKREVLDLVARKGPLSLDEIVSQTPMYSRDEIYQSLTWGEEEGLVQRLEGDLEKYGTTADVWVWTNDSE